MKKVAEARGEGKEGAVKVGQADDKTMERIKRSVEEKKRKGVM